jgi:uncharacterized tellurite resistance protein B-like protein
MNFHKFLGGAAPSVAPPPPTTDADTETVRRIVGQLEAMPHDRARYLAAFAYILTRAAEGDMEISAGESREIEILVAEQAGLPQAQAVLVAEMARHQALLYGGTEDYLVTRQFKELSTDGERLALLRCCYLVSAADDDISIGESDTLQDIAVELDVDRQAVKDLREEFASKLSTIKALHRLRGDAEA